MNTGVDLKHEVMVAAQVADTILAQPRENLVRPMEAVPGHALDRQVVAIEEFEKVDFEEVSWVRGLGCRSVLGWGGVLGFIG